MIPDQLPHRASKGEERLFNILKRLPDNYIVYYEPIVENRYPDFVIICPDMGLMIIEVKGWYPKEIIAADCNSVLIKGQHGEARYNHPVRQARDYMLSLMDQCRDNLSCKRLLAKEGEHQNKFIFPFGHFAVLSNITSENLLNHPAGDLTTVFSADKNITRDVLMEWSDNDDFTESDICEILQDKFDPFWKIPPLTEEQIDILRSIIHPEIIISSTTEKSESLSTKPILKVLDLKQEQNARKIGDGHRIIFGVAGSGKTVLLISKARLISTQRPSDKVLLLCYNVALSAYLKSCLVDCPNINVMHFDGWSKSNGVVRRNKESNESLGKRLLQVLENGNGDARKYQLVMIDEAQDFDSTWFKCALESMSDPYDGDLIIVGDGNQGLYANREISWSDIGIHARGRTIYKKFDLDKNYRNSREIIDLAALFAHRSEEYSEEGNGILSILVDPNKCQRPTGIKPFLIKSNSRYEENTRVLKVVKDLLDGRWFGQAIEPLDPKTDPKAIGILYPFINKQDHGVFSNLLKSLEELCPVIWINRDQESRKRITEPGIKIQTMHSAKGLQYRAVILLWADHLPIPFGDSDEESGRRLLYVALTRAEDYLVISSSSQSKFLGEIEQTNKVMYA